MSFPMFQSTEYMNNGRTGLNVAQVVVEEQRLETELALDLISAVLRVMGPLMRLNNVSHLIAQVAL